MQLVIVGIGGQGILFASRVIGDLSIRKGLPIIGSEVHGMAQRGGSVISHVKVGPYSGPLVLKGEADLLLAFDQDEAIRNMDYLRRGGTSLVNVHDPSRLANEHLSYFVAERGLDLRTIWGYKLLKEELRLPFGYLNALMLGKLASLGLEPFDEEGMRESLKRVSPPKHLEANLKAFELGLRS